MIHVKRFVLGFVLLVAAKICMTLVMKAYMGVAIDSEMEVAVVAALVFVIAYVVGGAFMPEKWKR